MTPSLETRPAFVPPPAAAAPQPSRLFTQTRYHYTTGVRTGHPAVIRGDDGDVILSYRSFASITGIVAALVSAIVAVAGAAAALFLIAEGEPLSAAAAGVLTIAFALLIGSLVPRVEVTLYDGERPALTISQRTLFPTAHYIITDPDGGTIAEIRKSFFSRLGRNRWNLFEGGRPVGTAVEEGLGRALVRKVAGKFNRRWETDIAIDYGGIPAARVIRRAPHAEADVLEMHSDALDRRIAVATAAIILGREP